MIQMVKTNDIDSLWPIADKCACEKSPSLYNYKNLYRVYCDNCGRRGKVADNAVDAINNWNEICVEQRRVDAIVRGYLTRKTGCPFDESGDSNADN